MLYVLLGISTVLVLYFYIITSMSEVKYKMSKVKKQKKVDKVKKVNNKKYTEIESALRFCPICNAEMQSNDKLYAEIYKAEPRDKVFIKGCRHCYALPGTPESQPDYNEYKEQVAV